VSSNLGDVPNSSRFFNRVCAVWVGGYSISDTAGSGTLAYLAIAEIRSVKVNGVVRPPSFSRRDESRVFRGSFRNWSGNPPLPAFMV